MVVYTPQTWANGQVGGTPLSAARLQHIEDGLTAIDNTFLAGWAASGSYQLTAITYDATYTTVVSTATVVWPDGSAGTYATDTINATFAAVDAYHITHTASGKTVTQAAVTRNTDGGVTAKPALTVA